MGRNVLDLKRARPSAELPAPMVRKKASAPASVARENEIAAELIEAMVVPSVPVANPAPPKPMLPRAHPLDRPTVPLTRTPRRSRETLLSLTPWALGAFVVIAGLLYASQSGSRIKERVAEESSAAIGSLLDAGDAARRMEWADAAEKFREASERLDGAGGVLNLIGPSVSSVLSTVPGLGGLSAGHDVLAAGRLLSGAGASVADALATFGSLNAATAEASEIRADESLVALEESLGRASRDIAEAQRLLDGVDASRLPASEAARIAEFREQLPAIGALVSRGADTVSFLRHFLGTDRARRYLILFENTSELRPTGGFPGTYGLLTTEGGRIRDWRADDVYNPDGQISGLVIPPRQLQHITPSWGMRDAAWWADWPTSAAKSAEFWQRGGGAAVDGVLAVQPALLEAILRVTGPISLPAYDVVVSADSFLPMLQTEVEENRPSGKPKQIIADLAPVVLEKLAALPPDRWPVLLEALRGALDRREVLMWYDDADLLAFADANGWSGRVQNPEGDFVMVVAANVKGAKTDAVTDNALKVESRIQNGALIHRLTLARRNDGHTSPYGFYNKPNYAYIRVLTPRGSMLRGITGNERSSHRPLITDYANAGGTTDADLQALEATYREDAVRGVTISTESDKTGFGFWMTVMPGTTETVQLEYEVPASALGSPYLLSIQKQPGMRFSGVEVTLDKPGFQVRSSVPALTEWPDSWRFTDSSAADIHLTAQVR
jgi:hypothetical protein